MGCFGRLATAALLFYPYRYFVASGGLMSYGIDLPDLYARAATYVDRLLRGAKLADWMSRVFTIFAIDFSEPVSKWVEWAGRC